MIYVVRVSIAMVIEPHPLTSIHDSRRETRILALLKSIGKGNVTRLLNSRESERIVRCTLE